MHDLGPDPSYGFYTKSEFIFMAECCPMKNKKEMIQFKKNATNRMKSYKKAIAEEEKRTAEEITNA